jgi:hypothetical protein
MVGNLTISLAALAASRTGVLRDGVVPVADGDRFLIGL